MRYHHHLAAVKPARTIGAAGLAAGVMLAGVMLAGVMLAGVMLAGGISGAPGVVSAKLTSADVPFPHSPAAGPLAVIIIGNDPGPGQGPKSIIIGDPGGDGPGPKAVAAVAT
jgi:hypothetical protein